MNIEEVMKEHGFKISASCAGQAWYTKFVKHKVTDKGGEGLPTSLDEPVLVGIHDVRSGDELEASRNISSLESYLESLKK